MKKIAIALVLTLFLTLTVFAAALPDVYEIPQNVEFQEGSIGTWQVPCIGTRSPLYETKGVGQDVIDAKNSALYQRMGKGYAIYDHADSEVGMGLWRVQDMCVGCGGFLCQEGKPEKCYECTAIYLAEQRGNDYYYHNKAIRPEANAIICVSCAETDGWVYVAMFEYVGEMP